MNLDWPDRLKSLLQFKPLESPTGVRPGIYHFRREQNGNVTRFHLRVEEDGKGLLLANASIAARLSPSGVLIAKGLLEGNVVEQIREKINKNFRKVRSAQLEIDIAKVSEFIERLAATEDNYPIFNLDDPALSAPRSLFAPFHVQMRVGPPELIGPLLQKLWDTGVLHVTFHAMRDDPIEEAVQNVQRAEDIGMISGFRAVASYLQSPNLMQQLALAGLDYATVPVISDMEKKHDSFYGEGDWTKALECFRTCRGLAVCPVAEIPLLRENFLDIEELLKWLNLHAVTNIVCYAIANEYQDSGLSGTQIIQAAALLKELAEKSQVRYIWQIPVSAKGSLIQILEAGPRTAGDISIRVEPDGSVYPARGPLVSAGNLNASSFRDIWNQEVFRKYRERIQTPTHCEICPGLQICAADCPGDPRGWAREE